MDAVARVKTPLYMFRQVRKEMVLRVAMVLNVAMMQTG